MAATFTTAAESGAVTGVTGLASHVSLHTADPGTTGAAEVAGGTYARVTWAALGTAMTLNVPASTTITHYGVWETNGTTFLYGGTLSASETYASAGTYALTLSLTAS